MRTTVSFPLPPISACKKSLLEWSHQFREIAWLDSNGHADSYGEFEAILAVAAHDSIVVPRTTGAFDKLKAYRKEIGDWLFGFLSYDLKNDVEELSSTNFDGLLFPNLFFFQPKKIIKVHKGHVHFMYLDVYAHEISSDYNDIFEKRKVDAKAVKSAKAIHIKMRIFKDEYFQRARRMLTHIHRGDIYEANFCQEFYAKDTEIDPLRIYEHLNTISQPPFAVFFRQDHNHLLCASPERYLKKSGSQLISQPIKGTAKRDTNPQKDASLISRLRHDAKERAENVMIVDLVRNDLSKNATKGSVRVEGLCVIKSYRQVHQMVSTISATVPPDSDPVDLIRDSFPMGSMTGAPKVSAMKIIEELESFKRGLYSGAVGYFTPEGNFDFNVVIRSILYNAKKRYVSFSVGSALTAKAIPEQEYEECLLKAKAMREVLEGL
ncbi:anthranilate synthase component I family protein [Aggregatimonas sangjinii]|uniref:Anthranilate synthase component I family protein n=1 Tax=Aggregatimonas sangjinii TaxID=2583587 RepID=A0A5B7SNF5_9FLAO|nr:anthranilate synthase component I family protein [Aggregatimonas sangjinii]QCX00096.1 anthranilate synthase component I family protein [Aggregatimonas sangjinii]